MLILLNIICFSGGKTNYWSVRASCIIIFSCTWHFIKQRLASIHCTLSIDHSCSSLLWISWTSSRLAVAVVWQKQSTWTCSPLRADIQVFQQLIPHTRISDCPWHVSYREAMNAVMLNCVFHSDEEDLIALLWIAVIKLQNTLTWRTSYHKMTLDIIETRCGSLFLFNSSDSTVWDIGRSMHDSHFLVMASDVTFALMNCIVSTWSKQERKLGISLEGNIRVEGFIYPAACFSCTGEWLKAQLRTYSRQRNTK